MRTRRFTTREDLQNQRKSDLLTIALEALEIKGWSQEAENELKLMSYDDLVEYIVDSEVIEVVEG